MELVGVKNKPKFDVIKALHVIEHDQDLSTVFGKTDSLQYDLLYAAAKQNTLSPQIVGRVKEIFERIILLNQKPRRAYLKLQSEEVTEGVKPPIKLKFILPKHYGKKRILSDIKLNKAQTELDKAMLALNKLRNLYAKVKRRAIKDKLTDERVLTTQACREIVAAIKILENKFEKALKK